MGNLRRIFGLVKLVSRSHTCIYFRERETRLVDGPLATFQVLKVTKDEKGFIDYLGMR